MECGSPFVQPEKLTSPTSPMHQVPSSQPCHCGPSPCATCHVIASQLQIHPSTHALPNEQRSCKQLSCTANTLLSFLSRGFWGTLQEEGALLLFTAAAWGQWCNGDDFHHTLPQRHTQSMWPVGSSQLQPSLALKIEPIALVTMNIGFKVHMESAHGHAVLTR